MTTHDILRERLLKKAAVYSYEQLEHLRKNEWSREFEILMRNRLVMGALRYGKMRNPDKASYNRVKRMHELIRDYLETHNQEALVDIANLAMLEFEEGDFLDAHFTPSDDGAHTERTR